MILRSAIPCAQDTECSAQVARLNTGASTDELQLISAAQRGDVSAFEALVRKYEGRLCSSLRQVCDSIADAQDAAQEAFLRAYLRLNTYAATGAFYNWLHRIALNAVLDEHRRRKAWLEGKKPRLWSEDSLPSDVESPDETLLRKERVADVQTALVGLSAEHRAVLALHEMEGLDYRQIAVALAIPIGTVRSRLHRARLALREMLTPEEPGKPLDESHLHIPAISYSSHGRSE